MTTQLKFLTLMHCRVPDNPQPKIKYRICLDTIAIICRLRRSRRRWKERSTLQAYFETDWDTKSSHNLIFLSISYNLYSPAIDTQKKSTITLGIVWLFVPILFEGSCVNITTGHIWRIMSVFYCVPSNEMTKIQGSDNEINLNSIPKDIHLIYRLGL